MLGLQTSFMINTDLLFQTGDIAEEAGDFNAAFSAFERGAELGDSSCWVRLGYMFDTGKGVAVSKLEAMRCYRMAWRDQDVCAANNIAVLYREQGKHRTMFQWYQRAADIGDGSAQLEVAKCYLEGIGVRRSAELALLHLTIAVDSEYISSEEHEEALNLTNQLRPRHI